MGLFSALGKVRKILGKLTDLLIKGRQAGLWDKKNGPNFPDNQSFPKG